MRLVTYDTGAGTPQRVGVLRDDAVVDCGVRRRHDRVHRGRRRRARRGPRGAGRGRGGRRRASARAAAPAHAARLPHLPRAHGALAGGARPRPDPAALVRGARVLQGPAGHRDRPGGGDPLAAVHRSARPGARARLRDRPRRGATSRATTGARTSSAGRSGTTCRRATRRRASCRSAWGRARPRTGTARTCSGPASRPRTSATGPISRWRSGSTARSARAPARRRCTTASAT